MPVETETDENQNADHAKSECDGETEMTGGLLRANGGGESPFAQEIPDADAEMEGTGQDADGGEDQEIRIGEKLFDFGVSGFAVGHPALGVQMPGDVNEGDKTGV